MLSISNSQNSIDYCKQKSQEQWLCSLWRGVTLFCMLWCRDVVMFSYFITLNWKKREKETERANCGNEILSGWGCSPSVSLSSWKSLPLPCCFSWPAVLTVPNLCACACMRVWRVAPLSTPYPLSLNTHTHTHTMNRSVHMTAQRGAVGMLLHSN